MVSGSVWASITKYCRLGSLGKTETYVSQFWRLEVGRLRSGPSICSCKGPLLGHSWHRPSLSSHSDRGEVDP